MVILELSKFFKTNLNYFSAEWHILKLSMKTLISINCKKYILKDLYKLKTGEVETIM